MIEAKPAHFLQEGDCAFVYREKSSPRTSNLKLLTCGTYDFTGPVVTGDLCHAREETLLFGLEGNLTVHLEGETFSLGHYDTLYVPLGSAYHFEHSGDAGRVVVFRARAEKKHPLFHSTWSAFSKDESRIRHLKGKDVFLMFDVSEPADRLIAGFTLFQPNQRSYPPHNHTDQEEIYFFTRGRGSMEVYADEETKTFVRSVETGDAVTIPLMNYHPVFSQEEELHFIWCIAGERYWVGDKNKDFMSGKVEKLTT